MPTNASPLPKVVLEFKSTSLTVPVLVLFSGDVVQIDLQLQEKVAQAPEFFRNSPLLLDLQKVNGQEADFDLSQIIDVVRKHAFMPVGIRGGTEKQNHQALSLGVAVHSMHGNNAALNQQPEQKAPVVVEKSDKKIPEADVPENKLINQPIRSGQRVYARGDLIVTASVSAGAEIMAEGNIHVYGTLRGRALAGVQGNIESRIFCSDLQAELISIAGIYQISDDLKPETAHKPVQISLDKQTLIIKEI